MKKAAAELQLWMENKKDYTNHLNELLVPSIMNELDAIYQSFMAKPDVLRLFQNALNKFPEWSTQEKKEVYARFCSKSKCSYFPDLVKGLIITNIKIHCISDDLKEIQIKVPSPEKFIHACLVNAARKIWKQPYLFYHKIRTIERQYNMNLLEEICKDSIDGALRSCMPIDDLLKTFKDVKVANANEADEEEEEEATSEEEDDSEDDEENQGGEQGQDDEGESSDEDEDDEEDEDENDEGDEGEKETGEEQGEDEGEDDDDDDETDNDKTNEDDNEDKVADSREEEATKQNNIDEENKIVITEKQHIPSKPDITIDVVEHLHSDKETSTDTLGSTDDENYKVFPVEDTQKVAAATQVEPLNADEIAYLNNVVTGLINTDATQVTQETEIKNVVIEEAEYRSRRREREHRKHHSSRHSKRSHRDKERSNRHSESSKERSKDKTKVADAFY